MCSRRAFLIGLFLLSQMGTLNKVEAHVPIKTKKKFLKQGWVLQEGDV
jgi:hypothetical protein